MSTSGVFQYSGYAIEPGRGLLTCRYRMGGRQFTELTSFGRRGRWEAAEIGQAARLIFLLAGVSYYKTAAPPVIDLGPTAVTEAELAFLREFYLQGPVSYTHLTLPTN